MESALRSHLLSCAAAYAGARKVSPATIGRLAAGDWRFFDRLDGGDTTFTARKYDDVMQWFSDNWPDDTAWPDDVSRPLASATTEAPAS